MTKAATIKQFFESFGLPAYPSSSVPEDAVFPWLTYDLIVDNYEGGEVGLTVNLWYYTTSEAAPNAKAQEISDRIGLGGQLLPCDGGYVWLKRGAPWCQSIRDEAEPAIKRRYINVSAEFLTAD